MLTPKLRSFSDFWSYIGPAVVRVSRGLGGTRLSAFSGSWWGFGSLTVVPFRHSVMLEWLTSGSPWDLFIWHATETTLTGTYSSSDLKTSSTFSWAKPIMVENCLMPTLSTAACIASLTFELARASRSGSLSSGLLSHHSVSNSAPCFEREFRIFGAGVFASHAKARDAMEPSPIFRTACSSISESWTVSAS